MLNVFANPFPKMDRDRYDIWQMLVERDTTAFLRQDWSMVADDFVHEGFTGIDARFSDLPDSWRLSFPNLEAYRDNWLKHSREFAQLEFNADPREALFSATTLRDVDVCNGCAVAHKKFDGQIRKTNGETIVLNWQTLYYCRKFDNDWKITGFIGFLPNPMGQSRSAAPPSKLMPTTAQQHAQAGPYSPVLVVDGLLVVISGQGAIDQSGRVCGDNIFEQTQFTLKNCQRQLESAGCGLADVFKVNVYLKDLGEWASFNSVYENVMPDPKPVRTTVQAGLLMTLRVEVEMWAVKRR